MVLELPGPLVIVGAGKMGGALLECWLARGAAGSKLLVGDLAAAAHIDELIKRHRIKRTPPETTALPARASVIVLAVKPQIMDTVLGPLVGLVGPATLVLSIAAGRTIAGLESRLPAGTAVVRAMPNTPASLGRAMTGCAASACVPAEQPILCGELLSAVGEVEWVADEALMDAVTAVSGSGPAYVFLLAECLAEAGRRVGLGDKLAMQLARATIAGSGDLLAQSPEAPCVLRQNVTSPGGTT